MLPFKKHLYFEAESHEYMNAKLSWIVTGLVFSILWASASTATKMGLQSAQPLVIAVIRFGVASGILLAVSHLVLRNRLPEGKEWKHLVIYGALNITVYLGLYVIALQYITAGIAALAVATNPVFISFLSVLVLKKKLTIQVILSLIICTTGVLIAAWPLLGGAMVTPMGLLILLLSMLSYSMGAIYFSTKEWSGLHLFTINGWQTFIGGVLLLPFALFSYSSTNNYYDRKFWISALWLAIPVSIFAVQLWLRLLKANAVSAALWLFVCPLFGFLISAWVMHERITAYTVCGLIVVIAGLFVARKVS
jgi:probable blue pigment (indigoidine) exporter